MNIKEKNLDTLSDRLVYALELTGTRKADLARAIEVTPQVIQFLCTSATKSSRFTFEIATVLGLNTRWLATGEGEMFLADDRKHQLFKEYKQIPIFSNEQLFIKVQDKQIDIDQNQDWAALKTQKENIFCIKMPDTSMEPSLQANSLVFFEEIHDYIPQNEDIALVYIPQYNAILIREINILNSEIFIVPRNLMLFNKALLENNAKILGIAIECHWSIKR